MGVVRGGCQGDVIESIDGDVIESIGRCNYEGGREGWVPWMGQ